MSLSVILFCSQNAQADAPQYVVDSYADMCMQMAKMATPDNHVSEWDIKDSPKLPGYCGCFGRKFADRAVAQPPTLVKKSKAEVDATLAEEAQMRSTCRSQFGLPPMPPKKIN